MSTVPTTSVTHRFTLPGDVQPGDFCDASVEVTLDDRGNTFIELKPRDKLGRHGSVISMEQFNLLRAKLFEVTGRVV